MRGMWLSKGQAGGEGIAEKGFTSSSTLRSLESEAKLLFSLNFPIFTKVATFLIVVSESESR